MTRGSCGWEAVKAIAAEDPLTSRLGHLPDALLGEVLSFAGDVRDGRRERRWNEAKVMRANIDSEYGKSVENPAEWEHSLDYFWDFHGPNPNPTTGYQADY